MFACVCRLLLPSGSHPLHRRARCRAAIVRPCGTKRIARCQRQPSAFGATHWLSARTCQGKTQKIQCTSQKASPKNTATKTKKSIGFAPSWKLGRPSLGTKLPLNGQPESWQWGPAPVQQQFWVRSMDRFRVHGISLCAAHFLDRSMNSPSGNGRSEQFRLTTQNRDALRMMLHRLTKLLLGRVLLEPVFRSVTGGLTTVARTSRCGQLSGISTLFQKTSSRLYL